ncbi:MAG: hypothetical protein GY838_13570 [bacterium]|nr:hypothetical protein [bacterium]
MEQNAVYSRQLSENFDAHEFRCRGTNHHAQCACHGAVNVRVPLLMVLQNFRSSMGQPVTVMSGFRCDEYNKRVGGHLGSFHRIGMAADITSETIRHWCKKDSPASARFLAAIVVGICKRQGNVIWYPHKNFIHVDVGARVTEHLIRVADENGVLSPLEEGDG